MPNPRIPFLNLSLPNKKNPQREKFIMIIKRFNMFEKCLKLFRHNLSNGFIWPKVSKMRSKVCNNIKKHDKLLCPKLNGLYLSIMVRKKPWYVPLVRLKTQSILNVTRFIRKMINFNFLFNISQWIIFRHVCVGIDRKDRCKKTQFSCFN